MKKEQNQKMCLGEWLIIITFIFALVFMYIGILFMFTKLEKIFMIIGLFNISISTILLIIRRICEYE